MLFHLHFSNTFCQLPFFRNSYLFVDFFFILSGFVLVHSYAFRPNLGFGTFIKARTRRILPLHLCMLGLFILLEVFRMEAGRSLITTNNLPFSGNTAPAEILPNALLLQSWVPFAERLSWNYTSWSISVEYYVYILFYGTLLATTQFRRWIWGAILIAGAALSLQAYRPESFRGMGEFFLGALIYVAAKRSRMDLRLGRTVLGVLEWVVLISIIALLSTEVAHRRVLSILVFGTTVFVYSSQAGWLSRFFRHRFFQHLGRISYSIYLVHPAILFLNIGLVMLLRHFLHLGSAPFMEGVRFTNYSDGPLNNLAAILVVAIVILLAGVTYRKIECRWSGSTRKLA